ncbi:MAG: prepilin-type N-terminal cleavage/methylation domain-containing protein [Polyangiales bacterium]
MSSFSSRPRAGFTTMELLIGVVIVGILAALAIPSFKGYVYRSRVSEGVSMLNEIKTRQESYRAKYGQYAAVSGNGDWNAAVFNPGGNPGANAVGWTPTANWDALGASPPGPVRFRYATVAGGPGDPVPAGSNMRNDDFWFAARAQGDLDGDGDLMVLEVYSQSMRMFNSATSDGGYE